MNIVDPILFQASLQPMNAAICAPGSDNRLISYGRLTRVINNIARALRRLGVSRGKIVAISVKDEIFSIAIALALARLGASSVGKYHGIPSTFKIDAVIADRYPEQIRIGHSVILADASWIEAESDPLHPDELPEDCANDLCRIVFTSGSTGTAKAVGLTHRMVADRVPRHMTICGARFPRYSRIYCDLSVSTSLGFQFLIYTLWRGGMFLVPGENFAQSAAAMEEYKAECWIASPGGLELLVRWFERTPSLASHIEFAISGGDKTSRSLADRVRARVCSHVFATYGSSEAGMTATAPLEVLAGDPDAVGIVAPDMVMQSVDEHDKVLPAGQVGQIRLRGPVTVEKYLDDEETSARSFRNGWFYPGDLGTITATNMLRIVGAKTTY
jgi:acyl-coenzyme A synthetase/AMP-(fatty) acid ligase